MREAKTPGPPGTRDAADGQTPAAKQSWWPQMMRVETVQDQAQHAVLDQLRAEGRVTLRGVTQVCPQSDRRDVAVALRSLVMDGALEAPLDWPPDGYALFGLTGQMRLTAIGEQRLAEHA
jgi:hypothetical protein